MQHTDTLSSITTRSRALAESFVKSAKGACAVQDLAIGLNVQRRLVLELPLVPWADLSAADKVYFLRQAEKMLTLVIAGEDR